MFTLPSCVTEQISKEWTRPRLRLCLQFSSLHPCVPWTRQTTSKFLYSLDFFLSFLSEVWKTDLTLQVILQTNINWNIQHCKQPTYGVPHTHTHTHTLWSGECACRLDPLHSSWETVNSLSGGDKAYFYHSRQTEETHWQADAQVEASERDSQTGSETDRQTIRWTDRQVDMDANRQAGRKRKSGCSYKPVLELFHCMSTTSVEQGSISFLSSYWCIEQKSAALPQRRSNMQVY